MSPPFYPDRPLLLVDDEPFWLRSLALALKSTAGIGHVLKCQDSREVLPLLERQPVGLIILDLTMPHLSGEQLLPKLTEAYPEIPIIVISGMDQVETAVKCMKLGAFDYFVKTTELERLVAGIQRALQLSDLRGENRLLKERVIGGGLKHPEAFAEIVTNEARMLALFKYVEAVAGSSEPLLITGESGVGKELIARASHRLSRPKGPWMAVNIAGLDDQTFSDTLFGHVRGAFTGAERNRDGMIEQAAHGTLFLDEIGDLAPPSQIKLLRLLQEREYFPLGSDRPQRLQARIVCATNRDLAEMQEAGTFRKDLFYRLCAHQVEVPPLRERRGDLPLLLDQFLREAADALGKKVPTAPKELVDLLGAYDFPGNVRQLRAMIFNAVGVHQRSQLSLETFRAVVNKRSGTGPGSPTEEIPFNFPGRLPTFEECTQLLITEALRRANSNQAVAASLLGVSRQALNKRLRKNPG